MRDCDALAFQFDIDFVVTPRLASPAAPAPPLSPLSPHPTTAAPTASFPPPTPPPVPPPTVAAPTLKLGWGSVGPAAAPVGRRMLATGSGGSSGGTGAGGDGGGTGAGVDQNTGTGGGGGSGASGGASKKKKLVQNGDKEALLFLGYELLSDAQSYIPPITYKVPR